MPGTIFAFLEGGCKCAPVCLYVYICMSVSLCGVVCSCLALENEEKMLTGDN